MSSLPPTPPPTTPNRPIQLPPPNRPLNQAHPSRHAPQRPPSPDPRIAAASPAPQLPRAPALLRRRALARLDPAWRHRPRLSPPPRRCARRKRPARRPDVHGVRVRGAPAMGARSVDFVREGGARFFYLGGCVRGAVLGLGLGCMSCGIGGCFIGGCWWIGR